MIEPRRPKDPVRIGTFPILARLGSGGFGKVYVACFPGRPDRRLAVKLVHQNVAEDPQFRGRFDTEIVALMRVRSEFVPPLVSHGEHEDAPWLATGLVDGPSLHDVVGQCGALPAPALWWLGLGTANAIAAIHGAALEHRDLKPGNVLLVPEGPRVIDFGLAHLAELSHHSASRLSIGTYKYASPEQLLGLEHAGRPADIFAFGATMLFAATGHPPYANPVEAQQARVNLYGLPDEFRDVVSRCLSPEQAARPPLAELQAIFAQHVRLTGPAGRGESGAALPAPVLNMIAAWRRRLDEMAAVSLDQAAGPTGPWPRFPPPSPPRPAPYPPWSPVPEQTSVLTDARVPTKAHPPRRAPEDPTLIGPETAPPLPAGGRTPVRWSRRLGDWVRAPVTVGGGVAVAASLDGTVACFRADSGEVQWRRDLAAPVHSAVLLRPEPGWATSGTVYAGDADGGLHVIDVASGDHRPAFYAAGAISGSPVYAAGRVYALSADGCIHETDPGTLSHRVIFQLDGPAAGGLTAAGGVLVAAGTEGYLAAISVMDRQQRWRLPVTGMLYAAPLPAGGRIYYAGTDGMLRSVRADSGRDAITADVGAPVHAALAYDDGRVYAGHSGGAVRAFALPGDDRGQLTALWTSPVGTEVNGLAASGHRIFATAGDTVAELDHDSGHVRARLSMGSSATAPPTPAGGFLYAAALDGVVSCVSLA